MDTVSVKGIEVADDIKGSRQDPYYPVARELVLTASRASISMIQRHLRIGYNHAARLLEAMEGDVVGPVQADGFRRLLAP